MIITLIITYLIGLGTIYNKILGFLLQKHLINDTKIEILGLILLLLLSPLRVPFMIGIIIQETLADNYKSKF